MKKTVEGGKVTFEGSPEELAAYERQTAPVFVPTPLRFEPMWPDHGPFCEISMAKRGWLSTVPPTCTCGCGGVVTSQTTTWSAA